MRTRCSLVVGLPLSMLMLMLTLVASLTSACAATQATVMLPPPPSATAPLAERDAYYEAKKPLGIAGAPNAVNQLGWLAPATFPILVLADGTKVADPNSLLPAVGSDSLTAQSARKVGELRLFSNSVYTVSSLALGLGLATLIIAPAAIGGGIDPTGVISLTLFGTAGSIGGALGIGWAAQLLEEAEAEKMAALMLYESDLRRRLALVRPDEVLEKKWVRSTAAAARKEDAPVTVPVAPPPAPSVPSVSAPPAEPSDPSEPPAILSPAPEAP